jgi:outer membrane receptor protein involved in Fe transport
LFCNTSVIFSDFKFQFIGKSDDFTAKLVSGIRDWNLKTDFEYFPNIRNRVKFGVHYTYHTFTPFNTSASQGDVVFDLGKPVKLFANELAFYAMDEVDVTDWLRINGGLRFSAFQQIGPFDRYVKNSLDQIIDTINYTQFQNIKTYQGFEPRISARISTGINSSI